MALDLTGGLLVSFLIEELKPVLSRHPRFKNNDGETMSAFSNQVMFRDVSLVINNLRGDSKALSPDYFVGTAFGRALAAQIDGKRGQFLEFLREVDPTQALPLPGLYNLHVDSVNEQTRAVRFIKAALRTVSGSVPVAEGSVIGVSSSHPVHLVRPSDPAIGFEAAGTRLWLLTHTNSLELVRTDTGATLEPGKDWWVERTTEITLTDSARGGEEVVAYPDTLRGMEVVDGQGVVLRRNIDWWVEPAGRIRLAAWTPAGAVRKARGVARLNPSTTPLVHPENKINPNLGQGETLVTNSVVCNAPGGSELVSVDGGFFLKNLLMTGESFTWELQVATQQVYVTANKMEMTAKVIPGLNLAIGDMVEVGDQVCVIVTPDETATYEIFGGKDSLSFDITIKANDLMTASELAGLVRRYLLIEGRDRMESAGISIFSAPFGYQGEARDQSGTTTSHSVSLSVSAAADWEEYRPLINRVTAVDLDLVAVMGHARPAASVAGRTSFVNSYA